MSSEQRHGIGGFALRYVPRLFRLWDIPKQDPVRATAIVLMEGQTFRKVKAVYDSVSVHIGKHGWALPGFIGRINTRPHKYASLEACLSGPRQSLSPGEPSHPILVIAEGSIFPNPAEFGVAVGDMEIGELVMRLLTWNDKITDCPLPGVRFTYPGSAADAVSEEACRFEPFAPGTFAALPPDEGSELLLWKRRKAYILSGGYRFLDNVVIEDIKQYNSASRKSVNMANLESRKGRKPREQSHGNSIPLYTAIVKFFTKILEYLN